MKSIAVCLFLFFGFASQVIADESSLRMLLLGESMENGEASSVAIVSDSDAVYGGLSLNYIHSSEIIGFSNRQTIYPVYVFFGLKAPFRFAPYVEVGFDLGDSLIDDLYNNGEDDESLVDYYYAGGFSLSLDSRTSLLFYARKYNLKFREDFLTPTVKNRPESYGMGLAVRF